MSWFTYYWSLTWRILSITLLACAAAAAAKLLQSCPTLCYPRDSSPPGSPILRILQARTLEWVAISFCRGSSQPRDQTQVSSIAGRCFILWAMRWVQLCSSLSILWHCLSLGLEWKLTFSSPVATAEFSKFVGILSAALSQHHLSGFEIAQLEFHHLH